MDSKQELDQLGWRGKLGADEGTCESCVTFVHYKGPLPSQPAVSHNDVGL